MTREQVFPAGPPLRGGALLASSFQYALTGTERLRVKLTYPDTVVTVQVDSRLWRSDSQTIQVQTHTLSTQGFVQVTRDFPLLEGALLNVRLSAAPKPQLALGDLFGAVQLVSGDGPAAFVIATLLQGYLEASNDLAWPGSPLQSMHSGLGRSQLGQFTAVAGPPDKLEFTCKTNFRAQIESGRFQVATSAVAGNRTVVVGVRNAGSQYSFVAPAPFVQTASQTIGYAFGAGAAVVAGVFGLQVGISFPVQTFVDDGDVIDVQLIGFQAGDALGPGFVRSRGWVNFV